MTKFAANLRSNIFVEARCFQRPSPRTVEGQCNAVPKILTQILSLLSEIPL